MLNLLFLIQLVAVNGPQSKDEFCKLVAKPEQFKELLLDSRNRLAFLNGHYGFLNSGICWWHSRYERNATMLAVYRPDLPKPTLPQAKKIIAQFAKGELFTKRRVVEIPGYENLQSFSAEYELLIIKEMESWQNREVFWGFDWLTRGAGLNDSMPPAKLWRTMGKLYDQVVNKNRLTHVRMKLDGFTSHALTIYDMEKNDHFYVVHYIDSNSHYPERTTVRFGDSQFSAYEGAPYIDREHEFNLATSAQLKYCGKN